MHAEFSTVFFIKTPPFSWKCYWIEHEAPHFSALPLLNLPITLSRKLKESKYINRVNLYFTLNLYGFMFSTTFILAFLMTRLWEKTLILLHQSVTTKNWENERLHITGKHFCKTPITSFIQDYKKYRMYKMYQNVKKGFAVFILEHSMQTPISFYWEDK